MAPRLPRDWSRWCDHVRDQSRFYIKDVSQWSSVDQIDFDAWLGNFPDDVGRFVALKLVNRTIYYSERDIRRLLQHALGKVLLYDRSVAWASESGFEAGHASLRGLAEEAIRSYRFAPLLDEGHPSESGNQLCRYLVHDFEVPELQMCQPAQLAALAHREVVLLDDFVGSGQQAIDFWTQPKLDGRALQDIAAQNDLRVTYLALVATRYGLGRIAAEAPGLRVLSCEVLEDLYRVFHEPSLFFGGEDDTRSAKQYLEDLCGSGSVPLKGFRDLDYAVSFHHGTPDATLPLFWWRGSPTWKPLFRR